ncbi:hypothetical protein BC358_03955 [Hydrogenophaga sp. H7]|nr:hypothetical protein BC358_03955 [Hydrogenophaga sp. H7]
MRCKWIAPLDFAKFPRGHRNAAEQWTAFALDDMALEPALMRFTGTPVDDKKLVVNEAPTSPMHEQPSLRTRRKHGVSGRIVVHEQRTVQMLHGTEQPALRPRQLRDGRCHTLDESGLAEILFDRCRRCGLPMTTQIRAQLCYSVIVESGKFIDCRGDRTQNTETDQLQFECLGREKRKLFGDTHLNPTFRSEIDYVARQALVPCNGCFRQHG